MASWVMSWGHTRHSKEGACRRTLPCSTQILTHRAMNILSGGASTQGPKGQCTSRIPASPTLPSWPSTSTEPSRSRPQAAPQLPPPCSGLQASPCLALGVPPPQAQPCTYGDDRQQHRTTYMANPSEQSGGRGSHLPGTLHCQRLIPPHFHRAEPFPQMSQWQAQSLALTRTPGFFM